MQQPLLLLKTQTIVNYNVSRCVSLCVSLCVSPRRAYFTAAQSLPWQVSNQQRYKIFWWSCKSSTCLREPPELGKKNLQTITTSLLAQHYETLLRDGLRCRCLIITSNSNSVFSRWASCQNQAHQLGPPRCRIAAAECYLCVLNCTK